MSHRGAAAALWLVLAVCAGTGCIPIPVSVVETGLTSGERLRAIHQQLADLDSMPQNDDPTVVQMRMERRMELMALRRQLEQGQAEARLLGQLLEQARAEAAAAAERASVLEQELEAVRASPAGRVFGKFSSLRSGTEKGGRS